MRTLVTILCALFAFSVVAPAPVYARGNDTPCSKKEAKKKAREERKKQREEKKEERKQLREQQRAEHEKLSGTGASIGF